MLCDDRNDVSEGIGVNKTSQSKECDICQYWYFLNKGFKFQSYVCIYMSWFSNDVDEP